MKKSCIISITPEPKTHLHVNVGRLGNSDASSRRHQTPTHTMVIRVFSRTGKEKGENRGKGNHSGKGYGEQDSKNPLNTMLLTIGTNSRNLKAKARGKRSPKCQR